MFISLNNKIISALLPLTCNNQFGWSVWPRYAHKLIENMLWFFIQIQNLQQYSLCFVLWSSKELLNIDCLIDLIDLWPNFFQKVRYSFSHLNYLSPAGPWDLLTLWLICLCWWFIFLSWCWWFTLYLSKSNASSRCQKRILKILFEIP